MTVLGCGRKKREREMSLSAVKHVICMSTAEWPIPLGVCAWIHAVSAFLMLCVALVSVRCDGSQKHIYISEGGSEERRFRAENLSFSLVDARILSLYIHKNEIQSSFSWPLWPLGAEEPYTVTSMGILLHSNCFHAAGDISSHSASCFHAAAL